MTDTAEKTRTEKATEPAKRWRNKYVAQNTGRYSDTIERKPGDEYWGSGVWPSKEIAEQQSLNSADHQSKLGWKPDEWLGAFPDEGQKP